MFHSGIDPVPSAAVRGPRSPAFLKPNRNKNLSVPISEVSIGIPGGDFDQGKGSNLRTKFGLLDKPIFCAELGIAVSISGGSSFRVIKSCRRDHVELEVRISPVIHFDVRG